VKVYLENPVVPLLFILLIALMAITAFASCGANEDLPKDSLPSDEAFEKVIDGDLTDVYYFEDLDRQVGCWVFSGFERAGVSCLPFGEYRR
jgi:hypothetical protein